MPMKIRVTAAGKNDAFAQHKAIALYGFPAAYFFQRRHPGKRRDQRLPIEGFSMRSLDLLAASKSNS